MGKTYKLAAWCIGSVQHPPCIDINFHIEDFNKHIWAPFTASCSNMVNECYCNPAGAFLKFQ